MYKDIGGCDMKYEQFKEMCRKTWIGSFEYLSIEKTNVKIEGKHRIFMESKNLYIE